MTAASGPESIALDARAKINAFLRVEGKRSDGYHQISSLILPISLADTVRVRRSSSLKVEVTGEDDLSEGDPVGAGGMNLALVAALSLGEECRARGAVIEITKRIPVAAGLGGGSADAAATLRALNELWGCGLDERGLKRIAERVGSDVPPLLEDGPVMVSGRGDVVEPISLPAFDWALLSFDFGTRSPDAYRWWDEDGSVSGNQVDSLPEAVKDGEPKALAAILSNDLEGPVSQRHPQVAEAIGAFNAAGALGSIMSGSGPTVVALARDRDHATELADAVPGASAVSSVGSP